MSDEEVQALVSVVRQRALKGDLVGKRDYALLLMYLATGLRRQEVISLRGKDVHVDETLILAYRAKGGDYRSREVREPQVKEALLDYLSVADRMHAPTWGYLCPVEDGLHI
jgi:integrase